MDELQARLFGDTLVLSDLDQSILEKNLYGVDLNDESVEIARLSLWLRTARPNRTLNDLSNNIKVGNSLIDDPAVAGDKAFDWHKEFPHVFSRGGFDVVVGNPPYGASFNRQEKEFYRTNDTARKLMTKIRRNSFPLSQHATIKAGVKPYEVGKGIPPQSAEILREKPYTSFVKLDISWDKVIRGTNVVRYNILWEGEYLKYGEWLAAPRTIDLFHNQKLVIRRTDDKLYCALDNDHYFGLNSIHCLKLKKKELDYKYILAIINSKLINWVFQHDNFHMVGKPLAGGGVGGIFPGGGGQSAGDEADDRCHRPGD